MRATSVWAEGVLEIAAQLSYGGVADGLGRMASHHHNTADKERNPHSPLTSFLWCHIGWLVIKSDNADD